MIKPLKKYSGWVFALFCVHAYAQDDIEDFYEDEEFVAISTGTAKPIYRAPAVANVITADDIKRLGATTLDEILETVPGMHVNEAISPPSASGYIVRGFGSYNFNSQLLTLINGVSIDTASSGGRPNAFRLPLANIERIEIIRGPGSAVYGADAYAGVINIITKDGKSEQGTQLGVRTGSFDTHEAWISYGGTVGDWNFYFGLDHQSTNGDDDRIVEADLQTGLDSGFGANASLAPGALNTQYEATDIRFSAATGDWQAHLSHLEIANAGTGGGAAQALDPAGEIDSSLSTFDITYHNQNFTEDWDLKTVFAYTKIEGKPDFQILPPGSTVPIGGDGNLFTTPSADCPEIEPDTPFCIVTFTDGILGNPYFEEDHYRIEGVALYKGFDKHNIRVSAGAQNQEVKASETKNFGSGVIDGTDPVVGGALTDVTNTDGIYLRNSGEDRSVTFLSVQDEWAIDNDWELTAGVRFDDYSDFGSTLNPRLALVWQTTYNLTSKLLYGRAFRAPSINELFLQNNPVVLGTESLDPETIQTVELVFDYRPTFDSQIIFNTFLYEAEDLIRFVREASGGNSSAKNTEGQDGYGFEIEAKTEINKSLDLYANFSHIDAEDKITGDDVADIPTRQFYLNATWRLFNDWRLTSQFNWVGGRKRLRKDPNNLDFVADSRDEIDDYTTVDFILRGDNLFSGINTAIIVRNAFDEDARDPSPAPNVAIPEDFPLAGRSVHVEFGIEF